MKKTAEEGGQEGTEKKWTWFSDYLMAVEGKGNRENLLWTP